MNRWFLIKRQGFSELGELALASYKILKNFNLLFRKSRICLTLFLLLISSFTSLYDEQITDLKSRALLFVHNSHNFFAQIFTE